MSATTETHEFRTETRQLLDLMVHSIYSNKDIFLRELVSNASDALDKRRFESLTRPEALEVETELQIRLDADPDTRTVAVSDNGIGMTRDEVVCLIGTIAKSGTREFLEEVRQRKDQSLSDDLIGQFGVGFYSSFMVADRVILVTRKLGEEKATRWESTGEGTYTLAETDRDEPGTTVTVHLKPADQEDGLKDYADEWVIRGIVKRYSDFVAYPIRLPVKRSVQKPDGDEEEKPAAPAGTTTEIETLNSMKAIWVRDEKEVSEEEYSEFYKHIAHDWNEPLLRIRAKIEGTLEYRMLLFIPAVAPMDLFLRERPRGIHLYVKRVFIMDDCKELLPDYLRFVRGVVDSEDLSLNISRELLQQDRQIRRMAKGLVNKLLGTLADLKSSDEEKYLQFWSTFARVIKEGLYSDPDNSKALLDLLLCQSTRDASKLVSLKEYVEDMKEGQDVIYYAAGEDRETIENSPHLEVLRDRGYEILLLTDPVDELWTERGFEFEGKKFQSVGKGTVEVGDAQEERDPKEYASILEYLKDRLQDHVKEVRLSTRLKTSPACLVGDVGDPSPQLEELLRATHHDMPHTKRILEVNPDHAIIGRLRDLFEQDRNSPRLSKLAQLLYGQALIAEGGRPPQPAEFAKWVAELMADGL